MRTVLQQSVRKTEMTIMAMAMAQVPAHQNRMPLSRRFRSIIQDSKAIDALSSMLVCTRITIAGCICIGPIKASA